MISSHSSVLFLIALIAYSCGPKTPHKSVESSMMITMYERADYCGGANPSDEILEALKEPKPMRNTVVYIQINDESDPIEVSTDEKGVARIEIMHGSYPVLLKEKFKYPMPSDPSSYCAEWKSKPDGLLTIAENSGEASVTLHRTCNPCEKPRY